MEHPYIDLALCNRAFRMACRDHPLKIRRSAWEILSCLYKAKTPVSIVYISAEFNSRVGPSYGEHNSWFYMGLERLVKSGLAEQSRGARNFRRWQITTAGIASIIEINKNALQYLND